MFQTATNPQTGQRVVYRNGRWEPADQATQGPPRTIMGPPLQPTPQTADQQDYTRAQTDYSRGQAAILPTPEQAQRRTAAEIAEAEARAQTAQRAAQTADRERGLQNAPVEMLTRNLIDMESQFRQHIEGGAPAMIGSTWNYLFGGNNDPYAAFNRSGQNLATDAQRVFRVPGQGDPARQQEERVAAAQMPSTWNRDSDNRAIFDDLRVRIEEQRRALGLPSVDWEASVREGRIIPLQPRTTPDMPQQRNGVTVSNDIGYLQGNTRPEAQASGTAETRPVFDPVHAGHAMTVSQMISSGAPDQEIIDYATRHGLADPNNLEASNLPTILRDRNDPNSWAGSWIRQNPGRPFPLNEEGLYRQEQRSTMDRLLGAATEAELPGGFSPGAYAINAADALTFGTLDNIAGATGLNNDETVDAGIAGTRESNPLSSLAGSVAGTLLGPYPVVGKIGSVSGLAARVPQRLMPFIDDAAVGTGYALGATDGDFERAAMRGATSTLTGAAGRGLTTGTGRLVRGVRDTAAQGLRSRGIDLTVGQTAARGGGIPGAIGQAARTVENALTSIPGPGNMIARRATQQRTQYNVSTWDEALRPIGGNIGGRTGEPAVESAMAQVGQAYSRALNGRTFQMDNATEQALARVAGSNVARHGDDIQAFVNNELRQFLRPGGQITGQDMQAALRLIKDNRAYYASQPGGQAAVRQFTQLERAVERMIGRQHRDVMPALRRANQAFQRVSVARDATLQASNQGGVFTPAQLGSVARNNAIRYGGRNTAASSRRPFYRSQRQAQQILPSNVNDSGTGTRIATGLGILGLGGAAEYNDINAAGPALGTLGALTALYSRGGQRALTGAMMRRPDAMVNAGNRLLDDVPVSLGPITFAPNPGLLGGRSANAAGNYFGR